MRSCRSVQAGRSRAGLLLFLLLTGGLARAETTAAPPQRAVLGNGLVLLFKPNPAALTLAVGCFFRASALVETRETAGLRYLAQQSLLDLPDASGRALEERAAQQAMEISAQVSADYLETLIVGTGDQLPQALQFTRELLTANRVEQRHLTARKAQAHRETAARTELAETTALDLATAHLYRNTPLVWPATGTATTLGLQSEQVTAFWKLRCVPNNAVLTISGPLTWAQCREAVGHALGDVLPRQVPAEPSLPARPAPRRLVVYQPWTGDNGAVLLAGPCPGLETAAFPGVAVLSALLGSGEGSRFFKTLRDEHGLAYSVTAQFVPSPRAGVAAMLATCAPDNAAEVFSLMQAEANALATRPPTEAELDRAKRYLIGSCLLGVQRNADVAHYLGFFELLAPQHRVTSLPEVLAPVSVEDVMNAATWLASRAVWVQVGGRRPQ